MPFVPIEGLNLGAPYLALSPVYASPPPENKVVRVPLEVERPHSKTVPRRGSRQTKLGSISHKPTNYSNRKTEQTGPIAKLPGVMGGHARTPVSKSKETDLSTLVLVEGETFRFIQQSSRSGDCDRWSTVIDGK